MTHDIALVPAAGRARILAGETVQVTIAPHPFNAKKRVVRVPAGETVAEIILAHWDGAMPCAARADGYAVEKARWGAVCPRETLELVGVPQEPITAAIASIGAWLSSGTLLATIAGNLLGLALSLGAQYLLNALFPPSKPQLSDGDSTVSPTYSIGGGRNELRAYSPVPVVLGTHRLSPPYAAQPYTEFMGDDQFLRAAFCWGHGNIAVSDLKIGETAIGEFDDLEIDTVTEFSGSDALDLYPAQVFQEDLNVKLEPSVANVRTTAPDVDEFIFDIQAPQGLYRYWKKNGQKFGWAVEIELAYRPTGSGAFTVLRTFEMWGDSEKAVRKAFRYKRPRGQYDLRVKTLTAAYSGEDTVREDIYWTAIRGIRNKPPIVTDVPLTVSSMRIRATAQLSGNIETFNGLARSRVTSWNGSAWVAGQLSNNNADLYRHVLQGPGNKRPVPDGQIDLDKLAEWHDFCASQGFSFNMVRDARSSVWQTLKDIAAAGRAVPTFVDGKWSVNWESANDPVVQHFTPANSSGFQGQRVYAELPHAFRVRFINADKNYLQDERIVYDDGYNASNATRFEGIEFPGVTDPDIVWRFGRYHLAQMRLRRETYSLTTDFEHLVCTRGDRVRVTHDVPKFGLGFGRVKAIAGDTITLDGDVTMETGGSYVIRFRLEDGTSVLRQVVTDDSGTTSEIVLVAGGTAPAVGDLYMFGVTNLESVVMRVKEIAPTQDFAARLTLVDDAPAILTADKGAIPAFDSQITEPVDIFNQPPRDVTVTEFSFFDGGTNLLSGAEVSWQAPALGDPVGYNVQWANDLDPDWLPAVSVDARRYTIPNLGAGSYRLRVQAVYADGLSKWRAVAFNVIGPYRVPDDVASFRSVIAGASIILSWPSSTDALVRDYEIRYSPAVSGATWQSSTVLVRGVEGTSFTAPYARGSYFIKARSWRDVYSANATGIIARTEPIEKLNVVEVATDDPDFNGTFNGTYYDDVAAGVILESDTKFFQGKQFFNGEKFFSGGREPMGYYALAAAVDLGAVYTSRITASLMVGGYNLTAKFFSDAQFFTGLQFFTATPDQWAATAQVRFSDDDPSGSPSWTEWEDLRVSDYTARAFEFRVLLESFSHNVTPLLTGAAFAVDMPDRIVAAEDVQSTASGVAIVFSPAFKALKALNVTGQDLQQGDYHVITGKSEGGATVTFYNSSGVKVDRAFDYQAAGYGSIET